MNIIIPLGGKGERFSKNGYKEPKPLVKIFDKNMIEYVLDNIKISKDDKIFIIYNYNLEMYDLVNIIHNKYPSIHMIKINDTKGAVETLFIGIKCIFENNCDYKYNDKSIILDCDTFYTEDILTIFRNSDENMVFYTKKYGEKAIYSYIALDEKSKITKIREKEKISDNANTGAYAFTDIKQLHEYCKYVLDNNITFNNEPYTSCVISEMIKNNITFNGVELNDKYVFSLGTPDAVKKYADNTYAFLFDLDGTLVITDDIYFKVWCKILSNYHIVLTDEIFKKYIQGNNDTYVVNTLLKNIHIDVDSLSKLKDELFIENINNIKIIDGVYDILKYIKSNGHKCCIVTNCNRTVAEEIIKHIHIGSFIDFIISNNDCKHAKPHSEPYLNAITRYNINSKKCFIFEDSKSGILSGKSVNPKILFGIETIYDSNDLKKYGVNMSIRNYEEFDIEQMLLYTNNSSEYITKMIKTSIKYDINDIIIDETKLKGGFIADVIGFKVNTNDNKTHSFILKYENTEINNLSSMAKNLQLYDREYYFYTEISKYVNVKIPQFICLIKNDNFENCGVVLENLIDKHFVPNLNLNIENIDISLKIVDNMAKMHRQFWNKNLNKMFPELKKTDDIIFCPFLTNFISDKYQNFKLKWKNVLNAYQMDKSDEMFIHFSEIQKRFSKGNHLTLIHGDIKSPNIFYDIKNGCEPYFIDWQHCAVGKGVQDLIFFIIESFDITNIKLVYHLFKNYYYKKIMEYGVTETYTMAEYETDIMDAISYIPFFTAVWFGTVPDDELIDNNFPFFFINKLFYLVEIITKN